MDAGHNIYEISKDELSAMSEEQLQSMKEDVSRLDGYLKGRADSDRPKREKHERVFWDSATQGTYRKGEHHGC